MKENDPWERHIPTIVFPETIQPEITRIIDWEQRRYETAKELLMLLAKSSSTMKLKLSQVGDCVVLADKLINLLKKE